jgi:choline dehydrogenase
VVGGSGAVNGQVFLRGLPEDFDAWERAGCAGWGFASLLPVFRAVETDLDVRDRWHGRSGPIPVRRHPAERWLPAQLAFHRASLDAGFPACADANGPDATGIAAIPFNNVDGIRQSTALTHLRPARGRPNLVIAAGATACRLRIRGRRVTGLELAGGEVVEAAEYVLCAGVIGSPHLLMLSGIGPAGMLHQAGVAPLLDLPGVGRNLADHQVADLRWGVRQGRPLDPPGAPLLQLVLGYTAAGSADRDDMRVTVRNRLMGAGRGGDPGGALAVVPGVYLPASRGELRLRSADPARQPEIDFNFLAEAADRRRLREGVRLSEELLAHRAFAPLAGARIEPEAADTASDARLDRWLARTVRNSQHPTGTCRMGPDADLGVVVDPAGRVRGLDNLRVADASVFPTPVRAHINATAIVVAERLAALMRGKERDGGDRRAPRKEVGKLG